MVFRINKEVFGHFRNAKGWNKVSDLARITGYTKSYVSMVLNDKLGCSADFMCALVIACGLNPHDPKEWSRLFYIDPQGKYNARVAKYYGRMPYDKYSAMGELREQNRAKGIQPTGGG